MVARIQLVHVFRLQEYYRSIEVGDTASDKLRHRRTRGVVFLVFTPLCSSQQFVILASQPPGPILFFTAPPLEWYQSGFPDHATDRSKNNRCSVQWHL